jgi:thiaminase (transcriptional activator TenA)
VNHSGASHERLWESPPSRAGGCQRRWVETYADPGFAELAGWCASLLDRAAEGLPAWRLEQLERRFGESLDHELAFWDA